MNIVLNENEYAEQLLTSGCGICTKPFETFRLIARYYFDKGFNTKEVRKKLEDFILRRDPEFNFTKKSDYLDTVISNAAKRPAVNINSICITNAEMRKIDSLDQPQIKRLAFTLLCLAKYWHEIKPDGDYWVNNKDPEIMALANINTSIKRQGLMYWTLRETGMVQFSKKVDNTNVKVCFIEDGEVVLHITDFRNLGYQYLMYHGEPYFECTNCGIITKYANPQNKNSLWKQKYCTSCATQLAIQQRVNSVMNSRHKGKQQLTS